MTSGMTLLEELKNEIRERCLNGSHWEQLLLQGFWYGLLSWLTTCAEDQKDPIEHKLTAKQIVTYSDAEFETWPADWLDPIVTKVIDLHLNLEQLTTFIDELDVLFRDCIPTDLDIFSTFASGEFLTKEQWERLYVSVAFLPPPVKETLQQHMRHKTRRSHGRRALTPLRRRKAITHHHRQTKIPLSVVKMK